MPENKLTLWVIYHRPKDYPNSYVVRKHTVLLDSSAVVADAEPYCVVMSLGEARGFLPAGLHYIGRHKDDDPVIVEVWV